MDTPFICYTIDPNRLPHFRQYIERELEAIRNAGGNIIGYWLPTDFAAATNIAYGIIYFLPLSAYELYRKALADELAGSDAIINMERSLLERTGGET